jgi:glyoxylase-like metal-dependent hydrolase (beta-lactamase superfamily II)
MGHSVNIRVHGRGNAWPVMLGEEHPFYDRKDYRDLSNAAFSLEVYEKGSLLAEVLVDAGHGTVQSLISGPNRIPHCICLTHGHMDHTLGVDWVVQSHTRRQGGRERYPVYASHPVYHLLILSYPQLESLTEHRELLPGEPVSLEVPGRVVVRAYPVYHGPHASGASMLLFETAGKKILFTGDLITPLLREEDYAELEDVDLVVVDSNNRFPWPRTNHWSFSGHPERPMERAGPLLDFLEKMDPHDFTDLHEMPAHAVTGPYLDTVRKQWDPVRQPFTLLEFVQRIRPGRVALVHYSGSEDERHYGLPRLSATELLDWALKTSAAAGGRAAFHIPAAGENLVP